MRVVVAGLGVQGYKRRAVAGTECVATVDPLNPDADHRDLDSVPSDSFDAVLACVPDAPKIDLIESCVQRGKHVLVEKPLWAEEEPALKRLEEAANAAGVVVYTAYNHRFEPHFEAMRALVASGRLGQLYRCRMFYGNGTARQVRDSAWRDHVVIKSEGSVPRLQLEMSLLSWRNHFTCDLIGENGSAHIDSLCKWGPTSFTVRDRVLPSGRPPEDSRILVQADPTWELEYAHFKMLCANRIPTDLSGDRWLRRTLSRLEREVPAA
jgi:scyllo-inositol 2-dehydrogenase (NADP+)